MYFKQFPKIKYAFDLTSQGSTYAATNIFSRFSINSAVLNNSIAFYKYIYTDSDTPEIISYNEYGDAQYHWIVCMVNQVFDPLFQFPLNRTDLEKKILKEYGYTTISQAYANTHHYELEVTKKLTDITNFSTTEKEKYTVTLEQYDYRTNTLTANTVGDISTRTYNFRANNSDPTSAITSTLVVTENFKTVSVYDYEVELNESKREIKLLKSQYIQPLLLEFENVLNV